MFVLLEGTEIAWWSIPPLGQKWYLASARYLIRKFWRGMPTQGLLRVHGEGEVEVELVIAALADLRNAYNSIILFESIIDGLQRASRDFHFPRYPFGLYMEWPLARRRGVGYVRDWPPSPEEIASFVPRSEQLVLRAAQLSSPGAWGT